MSSRRPSLSLQRDVRPTVNIFDVESPELEDVTCDDEGGEFLRVTFHDSNLSLRTGSLLGKGGFGEVYAARSVSGSGDAFALKVSSRQMSDSDWERLREEVTLMSHFSQHPNVVRFFTAGRDDTRAYVVMERCLSKSLHDVLARRVLSLDEILWIGYQLVTTIQFLHHKGCIHRDLKPANLLFDFGGNIKVSDFGLASRVSDDRPRKTVAGTMVYMAPELATEVYNKRRNRSLSVQPGNEQRPLLQYGKEVDIWSLGMVLVVMCTRASPYARVLETVCHEPDMKVKQEVLMRAVCHSKWEWPAQCQVDDELRRLVHWILNPSRDERPTIDAIVNQPIWSRRPDTCPLSLLTQLGLIASGSSADDASPTQAMLARHGSIGRSSAHTPTHRIHVDEYFRRAISQIESDEMRLRANFALVTRSKMDAVCSCCSLLLSEAQDRSDLRELEAVQLERIIERWYPRGISSVPNPATAGGVTRGSRGDILLPIQQAAKASESTARSSTSVRRASSVMLIDAGVRSEGAAEANASAAGVVVRSSPNKLAVFYPGRDTATKWSLRPCVSLPRDIVDSLESGEQLRCMNRHPMRKLTSMPSGYNGFDCNVCDRGVLTINANHWMYRCAKCDYDVCHRCADEKRNREVYFVCVSCAKKFPTNSKLQSHALNCRGPSMSPSASPGRSSDLLRHTQLLDSIDARPSFLDVRLPFSPASPHSPEDQAETMRPSRGGGRRSMSAVRLSMGPPVQNNQRFAAAEPLVHGLEVDHKSLDPMSFYDVTANHPMSSATTASSSAAQRSAEEDSSFLLPEDFGRVSKRLREEAEKQPTVRPRDSVEISPVRKRGSRKELTGSETGSTMMMMPPPLLPEEPVGIAAQRAASRQREASLGSGAIFEIRAEAATKPQELSTKPPQQLRKGSSNKQAASESAVRAEAPKSRSQPNVAASTSSSTPTQYRSPAAPVFSQPPSYPTTPSNPAPPSSSNGSRKFVSGAIVGPNGHVVSLAAGADGAVQSLAPPTTNRSGEKMLPIVSLPTHLGGGRAAQNTMSAMRSGSVSGRGSVGSMPVPVSVPTMKQSSPMARAGAYLALPTDDHNRHAFVDQFLSGPWVRYFRFDFDRVSIMHYCLQPGRYGCMFANDQGTIGTAVLDTNSKLVLFVPSTNNDSATRSQPHPHVQTFYDEHVELLTAGEANRRIPAVLQSIMAFAQEHARFKAEGMLSSVSGHAAYVHQPDMLHVPRDTKFAYIRKVFPDPHHHVVLFRLSNLRSQVILNTAMDIRWQSDRRNNVGMKYYVHFDGRAEPFTEDYTGTLHQLQTVIENSYRRHPVAAGGTTTSGGGGAPGGR